MSTAVQTTTNVQKLKINNIKTQNRNLIDEFDRYDDTKWEKADGWTNGNPFNNGWKARNVSFNNGKMFITIDNSPSSGKPYTSGEYRSVDFHGFGSLEASIKPSKGSGTVSGSLFFYTGPTYGNPWDEIDIEFLGKDTTVMQTNYITNSQGGHEHIVQLGFDASKAFHTYKIERKENMITWYVDGKKVHSENGSRGPLPKTPGKIMMNAWPGIGVDEWLGIFLYQRSVSAEYDWIKYTPFFGKSTSSQPKVKTKAQKNEAPAALSGNISTFRTLVATTFNGAKGGLNGNDIELQNPNRRDDAGYTIYFQDKLKRKLTFNSKKGQFIIVFIKGIKPELYQHDKYLKTEFINTAGIQTFDIPPGSNKINIMPRDKEVVIRGIMIK